MPKVSPVTGAAWHAISMRTAIVLFLIALPAVALAAPPQAPTAAPTAGTAEVASPKVHELVSLLADPSIQDWLKRQDAARAASEGVVTESVSHALDDRLAAIRAHIAALVRAAPGLPDQFWQARARVTADLGENGRVKAASLLAAFAAIGGVVEWLFRKATQRSRGRLDLHALETIGDRLRVIGVRLAFAIGLVAAFALGSIGPFLAFDWPPLLREVLFGYLVAFLAVRVANVVGDFLLAPDHGQFRVIPMDDSAARFWKRRFVVFVAWFAFGWVTVGLGVTLGYSLEGRQLIAYALGLVLVSIGLEAIWRRPTVNEEHSEATSGGTLRSKHGTTNTALSVGIVLLWLLWVIHASASLSLLLVGLALPLVISVSRRAVENLLRPPHSPQAANGLPSVLVVCIERGVRAFLIIGAVAILAWGWGVDLAHFSRQETLAGRLANGVLSAIVVMLIADLLWQAVKAAIDRKLAEVSDIGQPNTEEARRRARLRTLLPIFRNIVFVVVIVVAGLMVLTAMGVEIGPLIAGLGVLGVAIGFGAQTFVRDVIAGMFYLMDDAFRVGEYIQAGHYKGEVEGFSIRSVKLRHHRGPVFTVPFSLLGAVENMSRDWVIDKISIGVTYDSDLALAKKLIKQIGLDLAKEPDFAPLIIEPLKMQGVDALGDFAVQIRAKMMTLPGEQFVIRRLAYAMIKKAFDANGIKFAFPTVQIAGEGAGDGAATAAATRALELAQPAAAE
jgi:small-conductance mechanosensitive channel